MLDVRKLSSEAQTGYCIEFPALNWSLSPHNGSQWELSVDPRNTTLQPALSPLKLPDLIIFLLINESCFKKTKKPGKNRQLKTMRRN